MMMLGGVVVTRRISLVVEMGLRLRRGQQVCRRLPVRFVMSWLAVERMVLWRMLVVVWGLLLLLRLQEMLLGRGLVRQRPPAIKMMLLRLLVLVEGMVVCVCHIAGRRVVVLRRQVVVIRARRRWPRHLVFVSV